MKISLLLAALAVAAPLVVGGPAWAADDHGHDHDQGHAHGHDQEPGQGHANDHGHAHDDAAAATPAGTALPRFAAVSEAFELVGVLNGRQLTLYLDRFADNSPVEGATLEVELGTENLKIEAHAEGEFEATLAEAPAPGVYPVAATVVAGRQTDLLAGELDIHDAAHANDAGHGPGWKAIAAWTAGGLLLFALLVVGARRLMAARRLRTGGAA